MWVATNYIVEDDFIPGKKWLTLFGWVLSCFGFAEVVASLFVLADTSGYFIGGWYLGILCLLAGGRAVRLRGIRTLKWLYVLSMCAFIAAIIGTALQLENYLFIKTLQACSSYDSGAVSTCGNSTTFGYTCTGNSNYFSQAQSCEVSYVQDNSDTSNQCSCVSSAESGSCYDYDYISSCHALLTKAPSALHACVVLAGLCILFSSILLSLTFNSLYNPESLATREEIEAAEAAALERARNGPTVVAAVTISPQHNVTVTDAYVLNSSDIIVQPYRNPNTVIVNNSNNNNNRAATVTVSNNNSSSVSAVPVGTYAVPENEKQM